MHLKRTVYHIAGKDYEQNEVIEFHFNIQRVSINNFLNLAYAGHQVRHYVIGIGGWFNDNHHTTVDSAMKAIRVRCYASMLYNILQSLGFNWHNELNTLSLTVRNVELRAVPRIHHERYNGILVFDPKTKRSWLTSNSPRKIIGTQSIINGKLWRKYKTN